MIFSIRSLFFVFLVFLGALLVAATEFPRSEDTQGLYKVKVLRPKPNQTYRPGQKIVLSVDTAKPLSMEYMYVFAELIYNSHEMQVVTANFTLGVIGRMPVDGNQHKRKVVSDGKLPASDFYFLRVTEFYNGGNVMTTIYQSHDIPIKIKSGHH